ncbi:DUF6046 domain-containing protein [Flavobacterium sp.]|uniref:DUF6046 domain-containing protein n=1 Tax=Flavobacterium sp. TaxID=239 RepID=UPI0037528972
MALDNQDILFASLLGSHAVGQIERFNSIQNDLQKHVLPPIPFLPFKNKSGVGSADLESLDYNAQQLWQADTPLSEAQQYQPTSFAFDGRNTKFLFPYEPMLTISSGNTIAESNVAKQGDAFRGTVKERWSANDWDITITGVLIGSMLRGTHEDCFPRKKLDELFEYLIAAKRIKIFNAALEPLGILYCVVYDYSFPFTKGENVQAYEIKCKSDDAFELLIKTEKANVL